MRPRFTLVVFRRLTVAGVQRRKIYVIIVAHASFTLIMKRFLVSCRQAELCGATVAALEQLSHLFGLSIIEKQAGDFMEDGYCSGTSRSAAARLCPPSLHSARVLKFLWLWLQLGRCITGGISTSRKRCCAFLPCSCGAV